MTRMIEPETWITFEDCECKAETTMAILVDLGSHEVWIPKSQISDDSEVWRKDDTGKLIITEWIAKKKGL